MDTISAIIRRIEDLGFSTSVKRYHIRGYISIEFIGREHKSLEVNAEEAEECLRYCTPNDFENLYNSLRMISLDYGPINKRKLY